MSSETMNIYLASPVYKQAPFCSSDEDSQKSGRGGQGKKTYIHLLFLMPLFLAKFLLNSKRQIFTKDFLVD